MKTRSDHILDLTSRVYLYIVNSRVKKRENRSTLLSSPHHLCSQVLFYSTKIVSDVLCRRDKSSDAFTFCGTTFLVHLFTIIIILPRLEYSDNNNNLFFVKPK